jgi:hypothetical protein
MASSPIPTSKKILYSGITIVVLLLIVEGISRAFYYQQLSPHPVAAIQLIKDVRDGIRKRLSTDTSRQRLQKSQYRVRPGWSKADNDEIVRDIADANAAVYEPWVEFTFRDIRSRFVNVTGHVRRSIPDLSDSTASDSPAAGSPATVGSPATKPLRIFFLGGSTTYGFNVTDSETIPSCFIRAYRQKYPGGRAIRAVNLAMPSYYSYQELILLADKIFRDDKPDMVIMLDGLNDVFQANASYLRAPVYTPGIGGQIHPVSGDNRLRLPNFFDLPSGMSEDSACRAIYQHYIGTIRHAKELAAASSIPLYCFWQPVPYYNYTNRAGDPNCTQTPLKRFEIIYPLVKKSAGEIPYLFFLGDMLQDEKGLPFIDQIHYSPDFNRAIAQKMLEQIPFK